MNLHLSRSKWGFQLGSEITVRSREIKRGRETITYKEVEIGKESEDVRSARVEGGACGGNGANRRDIELREDSGEKSRRKLIEAHHHVVVLHFRHFRLRFQDLDFDY